MKQIVESHGFARMSEEEVKKRVKEIIEKNKDVLSSPKAFSILMGEVMKELRGKADGGLIAKMVKEEISNHQ